MTEMGRILSYTAALAFITIALIVYIPFIAYRCLSGRPYHGGITEMSIRIVNFTFSTIDRFINE